MGVRIVEPTSLRDLDLILRRAADKLDELTDQAVAQVDPHLATAEVPSRRTGR